MLMEAALYHLERATKDVGLARCQVLPGVVWEEVAESLDHESFDFSYLLQVHVVRAFKPDDRRTAQVAGENDSIV